MPVSILAQSVKEDASKMRLIMLGDRLPYWSRFEDAYSAVTPDLQPCIAYEFKTIDDASLMSGVSPDKFIKIK